MDSILQKEKWCYLCHSPRYLHKHHIFYGTGNRQISEANGFTVWLCAPHHNMSNQSVHFNKAMDLFLKESCQRKYEESHSRDEFMELVGRNYL